MGMWALSLSFSLFLAKNMKFPEYPMPFYYDIFVWWVGGGDTVKCPFSRPLHLFAVS